MSSVLDVGCARGTWLRAWTKLGIIDVYGIDGEYVDRRVLEIPVSTFNAMNLNIGFDLGRQFDLVQSLEVGEHIEESASENFVDSLARHASRYILFSAAPPGQGGEYHINEQPYEFWRQKFERRGFATLDAVGQLSSTTPDFILYRYNTLLFIRHELLPEIGRNCKTKCCPGTNKSPTVHFSLSVRKALVRMLPNSLQHESLDESEILSTGRI